ncbi:calcium-binding protein [Capilliphycus salinus ALCB114379]|uniref:calcium-binding protein n=1 Tax=Capilliphycus salinus TaxID=2768948 RepID=UPI0039A70089
MAEFNISVSLGSPNPFVGTPENDILRVQTPDDGISYTLDGALGNDAIDAGNGNDRLLGNIGSDVLQGFQGNDTLFGMEGNDSLIPGDGNDLIFGNEGNDTFFTTSGNDTVYGGKDNDSLIGGSNNIVFGNLGNDTIFIDVGSTLFGGQGNDSLEGISGNQTLSGDKGQDTLRGGGGNDLFLIANIGAEDADIITEFELGQDRIALGGLSFQQLTISTSSRSEVDSIFGGGASGAFSSNILEVLKVEANGELVAFVGGDQVDFIQQFEQPQNFTII